MEIIILMVIAVMAVYHILTDNNLEEIQDEPYYFILETPDFSDMKKGYGNGYVRVSKNHPLFNKSNSGHYDEEGNYDFGDRGVDQLDTHGGITWCGPIRRPDEYVFGFDTSHLGDNKINCDAEYVHSECQKLLEQIKNIK